MEKFRPGESVLGRRRYSRVPFPPYSYVPGFYPHPESDPEGHSYGHERRSPPPFSPDRWQESQTYLYAIDLFNHGYYWEAHEAWESLWHVAGRRGLIADFLKGLIKLAAAAVKLREGNHSGVKRHVNRAWELLEPTCTGIQPSAGLDTDALQQFFRERSDASLPDRPDPHRLFPLILSDSTGN